jgi:hypothetical protein
MMEIVDIINKLKYLECSHKKYHVDADGEYAQLVFRSHQMNQWQASIEEMLGPPLKTSEQPVTDDIVRITEDFGEIFDHQILYYLKLDGQRIIAMFWPWQNQESTTLKIMILNHA